MRIPIVVIIGCIPIMLIVILLLDSFNHSRTDIPEKSDVIIMLGGGDSERMKKAASLYHKGYANYIVITPEIEGIYTQSTEFALDLGIPLKAIIEENEATSTYTNAVNSLEIMKEFQFDSGLVVTSDAHLKRTKMIFQRVNDDYDLNFIAALGENGETWKDKPNAKRIWFTELYKLWGYRLGLYKFIDE